MTLSFPIQLFAIGPHIETPLALPVRAQSFDDLYRQFNLGVYTALRTYRHNRFLHLGHHIHRTMASLIRAGIDHEMDEAKVRQSLHQVCTDYPGQEMRVRIDVLATPFLVDGIEVRELIAIAPFSPPDPSLYEQGVDLVTTDALSRDDPLTKSAQFVAARKNVLAASPQAEDCLLVDAHGHLLEGTNSNFYAVHSGLFRTANHGVLEGVTRTIVLSLAESLAIPIALRALARSEIAQLSEAAISSSSRGIMPVVSIDNVTIGDGVPGPIIRALMNAYEGYLVTHLKLAIETSSEAS